MNLFESVGKFFAWWSRELGELLPGSRDQASRKKQTRLTLAVGPEKLFLLRTRRNRRPQVLQEVAHDRGQPSALAKALRRAKRGNRDAMLGIALPVSAAWVRRMNLPAKAGSKLPRILDLEITSNTPFRRDEIYFDHASEPLSTDESVMSVRQFILKRSVVEDELQKLLGTAGPFEFIDLWQTSPAEPLGLDLLQSAVPARSGSGLIRAAGYLLALTAILAATAYAIASQQQQSAMELLSKRIAEAKSRALAAATQIEKASALEKRVLDLRREKGNSASFAIVWEELSRLLPDNTYLDEVRLSGRSLTISGFSRAAADLIPIIEASLILSHAALAAPVTSDPQVGKERFAISVDVFESK